MEHQKQINLQQKRRKFRVRNRLRSNLERPRLNVARSHRHIYAQIVDDIAGKTLVAASTMDKELAKKVKYGGNKAAAQAVGIDTTSYKLGIFTVAGAITALAGGLYAHYLTFINPSPFGFAYSIELLLMVVLGGVASLWGALLDAALVVVLVEALRALSPLLTVSHGAAEYEIVLFGLILMALMVFVPHGLSGIFRRTT